MEHPAVMGARASSGAAYARVTCIPAGTRNAPFRKVIFRGVSKWHADGNTVQSFSISVTLGTKIYKLH